MRNVPQLITQRLTLRGHSPSDFTSACELWQQNEVVRFITGKPLSPQDVWMRLLRYSGLWDFLGYGYWAVEDRETGAYIGQLGFADFKRGLADVPDQHPEAGWVLHPGWAGRGLATEGMQAACDWLDLQPQGDKSFCIITPANSGSIRLAQKLGYTFQRNTLFDEEPTAVYTRNRSGR